MPRNKDLKALVRRRMEKTGESYTAARAHLVARKTPPASLAELAGTSDETVRAKTGRTWKEWVRVLDAFGAERLPHRDISRHLRDEHGLPGWWAQTVTVGYERIRGLRAIGQRRDGTWEASRSRTIPVPLRELYAAFANARIRRRWLPDVELKVRTSRREKSMRLTWPDGTSVEAYFDASGEAKSRVTIQHTKLASRAAQAEAKDYWGGRLTALSELLREG